jgi:hypothetical protein
MTLDLTAPLKGRNLEEYGTTRIRNEAFEQVQLLWDRRKRAGWTQKRIADLLDRDPAWVSRNLNAPGNWTLRTFGAFTQALDGEVDIKITALEDAVDTPSNFDAYEGYTTNDIDGNILINVGFVSFEIHPLEPKAVQLTLHLGDGL